MLNKVELTAEELEWYEKAKSISMTMSYPERIEVLSNQRKLFHSLHNSKRIPEHRIQYFVSREYQTGRKTKSRKEIFESNGTKGQAIFSHPHFFKHLRFFIEGANVNKCIIESARKAINDNYYQDDQLESFLKSIKQYVPRDKYERDKLSEELFKLAVDLKWNVHHCHSVRNKVKYMYS